MSSAGTGKVFVTGKSVKYVQPYVWLHWWQRLEIWVFGVLYGTWVIQAMTMEIQAAALFLGAISGANLLVFLFSVWSVDFMCFLQCRKVKDVRDGQVCKVVPVKFNGPVDVIPLERRKLLDTKGGEVVWFNYRKQSFVYHDNDSSFHKLDVASKEEIGTYMKATGFGTQAELMAAFEKWGKNEFEFPNPSFGKLLKQQCMEPFFVFQVFCVGLWCMDEYWQYSLFTLAMLLVFESTVVASRLRTMKELRQVRVNSEAVQVFRCGKWGKVSGVDLLPGDVVSIGRMKGEGNCERTVPGDLLLLAGTAVTNEALLTGESTPQWKASILETDYSRQLSIRRDKCHILFGGTKVLQHTAQKSGPVKTPDGGCLAFVLRTGFNTSQGKLMRTILFSTERISANNWESGVFICFLVIFALVAAGYVLWKGLENPNASRYQLLLNCSLIITSVIPPELPMELSIAVNASLMALARVGIFCTEPFRIPFAGKVDICCFDKTGTLTADDMEFRGVAGLNSAIEIARQPESMPYPAVLTLACCHSLVVVDNKLVGDPLELAALVGVDWIYTSNERAASRGADRRSVQIIRRHHFSSELKRMAVVVQAEEGLMVLAKGAPEVIKQMLCEVPEAYDNIHRQHARRGARVLALASKMLSKTSAAEARAMERGEVERDLQFAGFAIFACSIRGDSATALMELRCSSHDLIMITGDQALTACHVAAQVCITSRPLLILNLAATESNAGVFGWVSPDEAIRLPFRIAELQNIAAEFDLCVTGAGFGMLMRTKALEMCLPFVQVYAQVSPEQKEAILIALKAVGRITLMCGDGTNDVGALKQAHVGVALLNTPAGGHRVKDLSRRKPLSTQLQKDSRLLHSRPFHAGAGAQAQAGVANVSPTEQRRLLKVERQQKLMKVLQNIDDGGDGTMPIVVRPGDASMAAPFTAKHASVSPVIDIIRQGRSTLVTTLQMYKILGLNCLSTAYVLSVLYLEGVKLGDTQATIGGTFTAAFFLFISHAKPMPSLSPERPRSSIITAYMFCTVLGQFTVHIMFLIWAVKSAQVFMPEECIEPTGSFSPNLVNTVSYMANMIIQVATFATNYVGHPFNQSLRENTAFCYALLTATAFFLAVSLGLSQGLNNRLDLVPLPQPFGRNFSLCSVGMVCAVYMWEQFSRHMGKFKNPEEKKIRLHKLLCNIV